MVIQTRARGPNEGDQKLVDREGLEGNLQFLKILSVSFINGDAFSKAQALSLPGISDSIVLQVDAGKFFDRCLKDKRLVKDRRGYYRLEKSYAGVVVLSTPETQHAPEVQVFGNVIVPRTPIKNSLSSEVSQIPPLNNISNWSNYQYRGGFQTESSSGFVPNTPSPHQRNRQ